MTFFGHQGIVTFFWKSENRGDGGLVSQRNTVTIQVSIMLKVEEVWFVVTSFSGSESFVLAAVQVSLQEQTFNKKYAILCHFLSLHEGKSPP